MTGTAPALLHGSRNSIPDMPGILLSSNTTSNAPSGEQVRPSLGPLQAFHHVPTAAQFGANVVGEIDVVID